MAAFSEVIIVIVAFVLYKKLSIKKIVIIVASVALVGYLIVNIADILVFANRVLTSYGYHSRTRSLIVQNLKADDIWGNIYSSGRSDRYEISIEWIRQNAAHPSGLGVIRNLTRGRYYMAHNLILELLIVFGIFGTVLILSLVVYRIWKLHAYNDKNTYRFTWMILIFYIVYSFTGESIFISSTASLLIGLLFFYVPEKQLSGEVADDGQWLRSIKF